MTSRPSSHELAGLLDTLEEPLSVNLTQSSLVLSSLKPDRVKKYAHITSITLEDAMFPTLGYIACPENTVKEVIHVIPPNHFAVDTHATVVQPCNPTWLSYGPTNSALVSVSRSRVPHYFDYQGTINPDTYIHKHKHWTCSACGELGHRANVCPYPDQAYCTTCSLVNPTEEHE